MAEDRVAETLHALQRRRAPALAVPGIADDGGQPRGQHVDGDTRDDLIAALADGGEAMDEAEGHRCADAGHQTDPGRTESVSRRRRRESRYQHLAFKADIHHAGALGPET